MNNNQPVQSAVVNLMLFKLIFLGITALSGIAALIYFTYEGNYYAAGACFVMEFVSYHVVRLNSAAIDGKLKEKYNESGLWCILITSIFVDVVSYAGAVGYAALGHVYNQGFQMENDGFYVCVIPFTVALLWSVVLGVDSRFYMIDLYTEQEDREALHQRGGSDRRRF